VIDLDELLAKLKAIRRALRAEYLQPHDSPWIVGFSGGKDSTLLLHLVVECLLTVAPDARRMLLEELLAVQQETGMKFISALEVRLVREQWAVDQAEESLRKIERIFTPTGHKEAEAVA